LRFIRNPSAALLRFAFLLLFALFSLLLEAQPPETPGINDQTNPPARATA
jgi:hypothetical protein